MLLATNCPRRALVGTNHRTVHKVHAPVQFPPRIRIPLECFKYALPYTRLSPPAESAIGCAPRTEVLGQVAPGSTRTEHPQDCAEYGPVIPRGATRTRALRRKQRSESLPLRVD